LISHAEKLDDSIIGFVAPHFIGSDHFAYEVNNEFNAVIVEGLFSDKQLFIGKGAGSYPTASAVLSDISALKFDYKYEYRKSEEGSKLRFSNDFFVKVYLGAKYSELLDEIPFFQVDEVYNSKEYSYQTGWIHFEDIVGLNLPTRKDLSFITLPYPILSSTQIENQISDAYVNQLETA